MTTVKIKKKLIEVALPLDAINTASAREKSIRHGHPSTLHLWWARRPLAAARAVIFAQMVDDPSSLPDLFSTVKKQEKERQRLFKIIEDVIKWENTSNKEVLERARNEIWQSWRRACADNADHPQAKELFDRNKLPAFHDPFAGGGALPLEAQRLGLESYASDLNPVAVLINKAMIEIPAKFEGREPLNLESRKKDLFNKNWSGAKGLAEDVRYYGQWMRDEAEKRIGHLYPQIEVTPEIAKYRPELTKYVGKELTVIAWLWARTVKSPNPAFAQVDVPLVSTFILSTKAGREVYIEPKIEGNSYQFVVKTGIPTEEKASNGTKAPGKGAGFFCLMSGSPIEGKYIKSEAKKNNLGVKLMAIVAEGDRGRVYLSPNATHETIASSEKPTWKPEQELVGKARDQMPLYGINTFGDLFTSRQLITLTTLCDLVQEVRDHVKQDARSAGIADDLIELNKGGSGATAYADAVSVYLAIGVDKVTDYNTTLVAWSPTRDQAKSTFARQALPMVWDFAEVNQFARAAGDFIVSLEGAIRFLEAYTASTIGLATQADAAVQSISVNKVISTDPPYYNNICYADLSDFFYVWMRQSIKVVFPDLFSTLVVPKAEELVATPYRHGGKAKAEAFFLEGMTKAMTRISDQANSNFPVTIYYAFKQSEKKKKNDGVAASTGWETFLEAVIRAGFAISGTWPIRTEREARSIGIGTNALASSIIIVCRKRPSDSPITTRREFFIALKKELPIALHYLQQGNIAPVDLAQAAIGPGMAVFTQYSKVLDAEGNSLTVRDALALINQTLDEVLAEQEGDFDTDSRWALTWFDQIGFQEGDFGLAEQLSKSKNTSIDGMVEGGLLESKRGKVRLLKPEELNDDWDPTTDKRLTHWETVHHLIRVLNSNGEVEAAELMSKLGSKAEAARELCYRLYTICERKKRASEALSYNALVQSWPELVRLSGESRDKSGGQATLFDS